MTNVSLRFKKTQRKRTYLYLDYYPPYMDPVTRVTKRQEYLGIYIYTNPSTPNEKYYNKRMIEAAENERDKRAIAIRCMESGIFNADNLKRDFLEYFRDNIKGKHRVWETAYKHFSKYVNGCCYFRNITLQLCEAYRDYLLKRATYINSNYKDPSTKKLSAASAYKCFSCFKQILKQAHKECILNEDLTSKLNTISPKSEFRREYLTEEEIKILYLTPCKYEPLKNASMFSIYTGLRLSDILDLKWGDITTAPDGKPCIRKRMVKGDRHITIFISQNALRFCGERREPDMPVFKDFRKSMTVAPLKKWIEDSGIPKHITFHSFRHTNATLLISKGVDIYTVSGMLAHVNVKTTQIYTNLIDSKKRGAADAIEDILDNT
jgi:integrase